MLRTQADKSSATSTPTFAKARKMTRFLRFVEFWEKRYGERPRHLVFDSKLTTYANLAKLNELGITFITLRRRSPALLAEVATLPRSAWQMVELKVPHRKFKTPRVVDQRVRISGYAGTLRQLLIQDLGHEAPTILLTNDTRSSPRAIITRYAQRMLIENGLADAVGVLSPRCAVLGSGTQCRLRCAAHRQRQRHLPAVCQSSARLRARSGSSDLSTLPRHDGSRSGLRRML